MRQFSQSVASAIDEIKYLYIRAGSDHRFVPVWVVVVDGRVLVRPWNDKPGGWYRALLAHPRGAIRIGDREVPVRAKRMTGAKLIAKMDEAYSRKYATKANHKYVKGFTTTELVPA